MTFWLFFGCLKIAYLINFWTFLTALKLYIFWLTITLLKLCLKSKPMKRVVWLVGVFCGYPFEFVFVLCVLLFLFLFLGGQKYLLCVFVFVFVWVSVVDVMEFSSCGCILILEVCADYMLIYNICK